MGQGTRRLAADDCDRLPGRAARLCQRHRRRDVSRAGGRERRDGGLDPFAGRTRRSGRDHARPLTVTDGQTRMARLGGPAALALIGSGLAAFAVVMVLGPSAAVPKMDSAGPLLWLDARPPAGLVIALERVGALAGALGTAAGLAAVQGGWRPAPRLLGLLGAI